MAPAGPRGVGSARVRIGIEKGFMSQAKEVKHAVESENLLVLRPKPNHHVRIALKHLTTQRDLLLAKRATVTREIEELDAAILALE